MNTELAWKMVTANVSTVGEALPATKTTVQIPVDIMVTAMDQHVYVESVGVDGTALSRCVRTTATETVSASTAPATAAAIGEESIAWKKCALMIVMVTVNASKVSASALQALLVSIVVVPHATTIAMVRVTVSMVPASAFMSGAAWIVPSRLLISHAHTTVLETVAAA